MKTTKTFAITSLIVSALLIPTSAGAHAVISNGVVAASGDHCVHSDAEVSHGGGGGYFKATTNADVKSPVTYNVCTYPFKLPPGRIGTQLQFYRTNSQGGNTNMCFSSGLTTNANEADSHRQVYGVWSPGPAPCTSTQSWFRTRALSLTDPEGDGFNSFGGYKWSGTPGVHCLPTNRTCS